MKKNARKILALLLAAVLLLLCTGCGRDKEDPNAGDFQSTGGKDVVRAKADDNVFTLNYNAKYSKNPLVATNHANQLVCNLVYENMVEVDNDFNVIPNVIKEWRYTDEYAKTWELVIDEGHFFHDGTEVTARDVSYSLGLAINADRYLGRFASFQGASAGEGVVYVALGLGNSQFIKLLNIPVIKAGTYGEKTDFGNTPIGSGPYTYEFVETPVEPTDGKSKEKNAEPETVTTTRLVAYEGYPGYEDLPVDTIYLQEYTNADAIISAFEDSRIDVVINDPSSYTNLGYSSANEIHTFATTNLHFVAFNEEGMLGRYSYFRVAMQYAFDREYLTELLHGNAVAAAVPMYPTNPVYPTALAKRLDYNLDLCKRILEAAGVQDYDEDGRLEFMSGSPQEIELNMILCSDSSAKAGIARRFQEDMDSIGLTVNVFEMTWDEYTTALEEGEFKVGNGMVPVDMYYGEVKLRNDFDITELIQVRNKDNERTNINWSRSTDRTLEDWVNLYLASSDAMRADVYNQMCEYLTGTAGSLVTIGFEKQQIITHRGVCKGIDANIGNPLYNFSNWTIDLT